MMSTKYQTNLRCFFELLFLVCILPALKCSLVIDSGTQKGIYLSDYCPAMEVCQEGSHVMCMYYNKDHVFGPRCLNAVNISMTPDIADKLLEISNAIRAKIAQGKEKGKDGQMLPRGYGIFKLKWDSELATFAQVLANQCVLRHDMCRATKRFSDPGQTAGLVRFSYPDWIPITKSVNISTPGLNGVKLLHATTQSLKSWYGQKNSVTKDMVITYPDFLTRGSTAGRLYLEMIYGPATHMGCGISAYSEFVFYDDKTEFNYNAIQIICNYSARPHTGSPVYNTVPPTDTDVNGPHCGCPAGAHSDSECLCEYNEVKEVPTPKPKICNGRSCEPTVVLLPIFTMEDTSPQRIFNSIANMSKSLQRSSVEIKDIFDILPENKNYLRIANKNSLMNSQKRFSVVKSPQSNYITSVKKRYFDKKNNPQPKEDIFRQSHRPTENHAPKKTSIFTRVTRFVLPVKHVKTREYNNVKRDVVPRKDFSDGKKLVNKYVFGTENIIKSKKGDINSHYEEPQDIHRTRKDMSDNQSKEDNILRLKVITPHQTEATLKRADKIIIHHTEFENDIPKEATYLDPIESVTQQKDNKVMSLLDTLEKEVKHIELHAKDKEIFDKKIRKIYGKIVGKSVVQLKHDSEMITPAIGRNAQSKLSHSIFNVEEILDKHEAQNSNNVRKSFEQYDEPTSPINQHVQKKLRDRTMYRNDEEPKIYRKKVSFREIDNNEMNSQELKYDEFDLNKYRKNPFKEHFNRHSAARLENIDEHRNSHKGYYMTHERDRDPLTIERRKYYQEKLDNMERRLNRARNHKRHRVPEERHMRAMLPHSARKSDNRLEPFYVADRARSLHGY